MKTKDIIKYMLREKQKDRIVRVAKPTHDELCMVIHTLLKEAWDKKHNK